LDGLIQEVALSRSDGIQVACHWRPRRPIPPVEAVFETVWRNFRIANDQITIHTPNERRRS
jgi:hypothetical protein